MPICVVFVISEAIREGNLPANDEAKYRRLHDTELAAITKEVSSSDRVVANFFAQVRMRTIDEEASESVSVGVRFHIQTCRVRSLRP